MLTVQKAREILGDAKMSDKEIQELLNAVHVFCSKFLDDFFKENDSD